MSKEEFIENIRKWVAMDTQIKQYNDNLKKIREHKNALTTNICDYMHSNSIQNKRIEISDGYLRFCEKKEYAPLTYNYIETSLNKLIKNEDQVNHIMKYLKENRQMKNTFDIRRNDTK